MTNRLSRVLSGGTYAFDGSEAASGLTHVFALEVEGGTRVRTGERSLSGRIAIVGAFVSSRYSTYLSVVPADAGSSFAGDAGRDYSVKNVLVGYARAATV